jgi:hypothetical protein
MIPANMTTQARNPWAAVRRTLLALAGFIVVMAPVVPDIVHAIGWNVAIPWVATALVVAGAITRVLAIPAVEQWLRSHIPTLAAARNGR